MAQKYIQTSEGEDAGSTSIELNPRARHFTSNITG